MKKEVLNLGHELIAVDYEFVNETAADVDETVIFPLPAYPAAQQPYDTYYGQPSGFSINVDGKAVSYYTVIRASINGADVTEKLRKLGLSDAQIAHHPTFDTKTKVAPFSAQQRQQMVKLKLIADGPDGEPGPAWEIQVNYVWQPTGMRYPPRECALIAGVSTSKHAKARLIPCEDIAGAGAPDPAPPIRPFSSATPSITAAQHSWPARQTP